MMAIKCVKGQLHSHTYYISYLQVFEIFFVFKHLRYLMNKLIQDPGRINLNKLILNSMVPAS